MKWELPLSREGASDLVRASVLADRRIPCGRRVPGGTLYDVSGHGTDPARGCVCAIGVFDGLHLGHRELLRLAGEDARGRGLPLVAVTFSPDPAEVLGAGSPARLLSSDDRVRSLCAAPVDMVLCLGFSRETAAQGYEDFMLSTLGCVARPRSVHVGADFALGAGRAGNVAALAGLGARAGFEVAGDELLDVGGAPVTATRIRGLVAAGDVRGAADLLGRVHFVRGRVRHGRGEGTGMGFPTANVTLDAADALPARGVYAGFVERGGEAWPAAINMGEPPTFTSATDAMLEANLLGFEGDLYGCEVRVCFVEFLRPTRAFPSVAELERTVRGNIDWVEQNLGSEAVEVGA